MRYFYWEGGRGEGGGEGERGWWSGWGHVDDVIIEGDAPLASPVLNDVTGGGDRPEMTSLRQRLLVDEVVMVFFLRRDSLARLLRQGRL